MVGSYQIIEQVGQGGMAVVYKAYHAQMDRHVALKIMPYLFAQNDAFRERFRREVRIIAKLEHVHILPVYDSGEYEGLPYLVMRYLETGTLKERMSTPLGLTLPQIDHFIRQLAEALDYAHNHQIIHRDVKPSNALIDQRDQLYLTDFGISKMLAATTQLTDSGAMTGTPAYMSPEQAQGIPLDNRSDIYSLGIILYELATGQVPFQADTPLAVIFKHVQEPLPIPSQINPQISPAVERVILKMLMKDPNQRFQSMREFIDTWDSALTLVDTHADEQTVINQIPLPGSVNPTLPSPPPSPHDATVVAPLSPPTPTPISTTVASQPEKNYLPYAFGTLLGLLIAFSTVIFLLRGLTNDTNAITPTADTSQLTTTPNQAQIIAANATEEQNDQNAESTSLDDTGFLDPSTPAATMAAAPTPLPNVEITDINSTTPFIPPQPISHPPLTNTPLNGQWEHWTGGDDILDLLPHNNKLYAATDGALVIWDTTTGQAEKITTRDGLPTARIRHLFSASDGTFWVATDDGVAQWDGTSWSSWSMDEGLDSRIVTAIAEYDGAMLASTIYSGQTGGGLNLLDGNRWVSFPNFPSQLDGAPHADIHKIVVDNEQNLWVGSEQGLAVYDDNSWRLITAEGLDEAKITNLTWLSAEQMLWSGTDRGPVLLTPNTATLFAWPFGFGDIHDTVIDANGRYWFPNSEGLARYNPVDQDWSTFTQNQGQLPTYATNNAARDEQGTLYFGTDAGLVQVTNDEFSLWTVPHSLGHGSYNHILTTNDNTIWITAKDAPHVETYNPTTNEWLAVDTDGYRPLQAIGDTIWAGGDNGLWHIRDGVANRLTTDSGLPNNGLYQLFADSIDTAWLYTEDHTLSYVRHTGLLLQIDEQRQSSPDSPLGPYSGPVTQDLQGNFWFGHDRGVSQRLPNGQEKTYLADQELGEGMLYSPVTVLLADPTNGIWMGTYGDGLYRFADDQWQQFLPSLQTPLPSPVITSLAFDNDGRLWIGTNNGLATLFNDAWHTVSVAEGLLHPNINDLHVTANGDVWIASDGGITRWQPSE
ncbi:MAG TPA: protein kinase [Anaerolineae bacterium]|nr:protein kinase [Anaerolineae bacterium]